jgi:acetyl esterase/lipase
MKSTIISAILLLHLLVPLAPGKDAYPPDIPDTRVETYKTVGDTVLKLWIFNPKDHQPADQRPAVVFFFGGGWTSGSPAQFEPQCRYFAGRGIVAVTVDYRVASRQHAKPVQCIADAKSAVRWVRAHAKELGIDPNRIASAGGSAGGHLAATTAFIKEFDDAGDDKSVSAVPNALVLFNPGLVLAPLNGNDFGGWGSHRTDEQYGAKAEQISPAHHIYKGAPPTIILHGRADNTVPFSTAEAFTGEMKKAGNHCELVGYDGQGHGFFNKEPALTGTMRQMEKFLASLGWLKGEPLLNKPEIDPNTPAPAKKAR